MPLETNLEDISRINFWDLVYPDESEIEVPAAFEKFETSRMLDSLTLFFNKKSDLCFQFLERVDASVASDYKSFVPSEMWLQLIFNRIKNFYYRSQDQLWFDLDLISHCSMIYNGEDDELTMQARSTVEKIRKELKNQINSNQERLIQNKKGKKFQISNVHSNHFGFSDSQLNPESMVSKKSSPVDEVGDRVKLISYLDGSLLIEIDLKNVQASEDQTIKRLRGRPRKMAADHDFIITIDPNEEEEVRPILNRRKRREIVQDEEVGILGKRSINDAELSSMGLHSNQENKRVNN